MAKSKKYILTKKTEATELYVVDLENKIDMDNNTIDFFPVFSAFIEDAQVYDDFEQATHVNSLIESQCELQEYKMKFGEIVLRSISLLLGYTIIIPLYFVTLLLTAPLNILSNLVIYDNFKNYEMPDQALKMQGTGMQSLGFLKIWLMIVMPIIHPFFEAFYAAKKMKF